MALPQPQANPPETKDPGLFFCQAHPKVETRLSCSHCETPICPKCMVVCEVGVKCRKCTTRNWSHVLQASPRDLLFAGGAAFGLGLGFGFVQMFLLGIGWIYISLIASFALGKWAGELAHRCGRYKLNNTLRVTMLLAAVAGLFISPFSHVVHELQRYGGEDFGLYNPAVMRIAMAIAFLGGMQVNFRFFRHR